MQSAHSSQYELDPATAWKEATIANVRVGGRGFEKQPAREDLVFIKGIAIEITSEDLGGTWERASCCASPIYREHQD